SLRRVLCERLQSLPWIGSQESRIRLTVDCSRHVGELWITVEPLATPPPEAYQAGVAVLTREMHRDNPLAKNNTFLENTRDLRALIAGRINEVLMVERDGRILEGLSSNFFGVREGSLYTDREGVLPGLTRSLVLDEARRAGIPVRLEAPSLRAMDTLEEAFLSSSGRAVLPVVEIDGQPIGAGRPGPITRLLQERYARRVEEELEWLCAERSKHG
ncbi:MAG: aminotransferase class IV, partial [Ardenticatenaceae bacterium]